MTSSFDLLPYLGNRVYIAFVFASDNNAAAGEGWYIDEVTVQVEEPGTPACDVVRWPGVVPETASFELVAPGTVEATWSDACNLGELPAQTYSIQAGDLDALGASGSFGHAPVDGRCDLTSPASFTAGPGNQYYLVLSNEGGREGSAGAGTGGLARPATSSLCGERRVAACP